MVLLDSLYDKYVWHRLDAHLELLRSVAEIHCNTQFLFIYFSSFALIKLSRIVIIECLCVSKIYQIALNKLRKLLTFF